LFRTVWNNDPATHQGRFYSFEDIRLLPKPAHPIDLWIGGRVDAARRRAARIGDGFHGIGISAEEAARYVAELRSARPEENFTVSIRLQWDQRDEAPATVADTVAAYEAAGVDHVVVTCARSDPARFGDDLVTLARALGL
jgi:alkanesulfonate monooxygenase SsuD/methylene tetrahydromethanopterin reductase-like flavin-dependent oxidoreductase (luciferase family)